PAVRHVVDLHDVEADRRLVGVDRERAVELLDAVREDVQEQEELGLAADDHVPLQCRPVRRACAHRKRPLTLSKNPSSVLYVRSCECDSNSASRRRCSSVRCRGTTTFTSTRWSPRPKPWSTGMPRPRNTTTCPGCVPAANSSSSSPPRVGIVNVSPSAACVI